jgi:hypothetical protein
VDDRNVTHHKLARERKHNIPPGPGSEGRGDAKRVRGAEGSPRARRGGRSVYVCVSIFSQRETEEKARQPETKQSAIARTRHTARRRNAKRS